MSLQNNAWIWKEVQGFVHAQDKQHDAICVLGPSGIGKTHQMKALIEEQQWDAYWIHSANCQNTKDLRDMILKGLKTNLISNLAQVKAQKVVVVDEAEVLLQIDRTIPNALSDMLIECRKSKGKVVIIGNSCIEKKIGSLKAGIRQLHCCMPSDADMFLWCKDRAPKGMKKTLMMEIAEACNGNPSIALQMIAKKSKPVFETQKIAAPTERDTLRIKLLDDPWLYPLRFHENLVKEVAKKKGTKAEKQRVYRDLLQILCEWDLMMTCNGDQQIAVEHVLSGMTDVFHRLEWKKGATKTAVSDEFTKVFSNLSLQKKQERSLYARAQDFPWMHAQMYCDYKAYK